MRQFLWKECMLNDRYWGELRVRALYCVTLVVSYYTLRARNVWTDPLSIVESLVNVVTICTYAESFFVLCLLFFFYYFFVLWFCLFLALYFAQSVSVCLGLPSWYIPQPLYSRLLYRLSDFVYTFFIQRKVP